MAGDSIYANKSFVEFEFSLELSFPVVLAVLPLVYIVPTAIVVFRILSVFVKAIVWKTNVDMDMHVFLVIVSSHLMNLVFFVSDYLMYRLPATGVLTAWCARTVPSSSLSVVVFLSFYSAYTVMLFPFLLSFIRLLLIVAPHSRRTRPILRFSLPCIFIYPLFFTFFLIPATGICKPLGTPYPFGSIMIYYFGSFRGIHNSPFYLGNVVVWMVICAIVNVVLLMKLSSFKYQLESLGHSPPTTFRSRSAEFSISLTTVSMLLSALINCIFVVFYLTMPAYINYITVVKPIGSDCECVFSPWIFYFTHPMFARRRNGKTEQGSIKSPFVIELN